MIPGDFLGPREVFLGARGVFWEPCGYLGPQGSFRNLKGFLEPRGLLGPRGIICNPRGVLGPHGVFWGSWGLLGPPWVSRTSGVFWDPRGDFVIAGDLLGPQEVSLVPGGKAGSLLVLFVVFLSSKKHVF